MKRNMQLISKFALTILIVACTSIGAEAQKSNHVPNTKSKMEYHGGSAMIGSVMTGSSNLYLIWYGCWTSSCGGNSDTLDRVQAFAGSIGATPYFQMNTAYPNDAGQTPSGSLFFGGYSFDPNYSHGLELSSDDIKAIVKDQIENGKLPGDSAGIYVIVASADVGSTATGLCTVNDAPIHGFTYAFGAAARYAFLGNPNRCPAIAGPQFIAANGDQLPTPNGDFASDVLANNLAHVLNEMVTNPLGSGWYDRYGLENSDKCEGTFGTTFAATNGARANVTWGGRDYLVQQNWVNDKKGRCAMQLYEF